MKYLRSWAAILLLLVILLPLGASGSDITNAKYYGIIQVTNNSTSAQTVVTTNISSLYSNVLIPAGFLNSSANNCAIRNTSGTDVIFMPGYNTSPWMIYGSSFGASSITNYVFYTNSATGGNIAYFPDSAGMNVVDAAGLEPGNNCEFNFTNSLITSTAYNIVFKPGAFALSNDGSGNVTVATANYSQLQYTSASSQYCHKDAGVVSPSGSAISVDAWAKRATAGAQQFVWNDGVVGSASSWYLIFTAGDKIQLVGTNDVGGTAVSWVSTNSTVALTQYFITATYDNTRTPKTIVYVNGNLWGGADGGVGGSISQPTTFTGIGAGYNGAWLSFMNGTIDEVRVSNIARTAAEHTNAYNSGVGNAFTPDTNTISLWHFSESTGATTVDAKGNNNLALVNNPTWDNGSPVTYHILTAVSGFSYGTMISGFFKQDGVKAWLTINGVSSANVSAYPISDNSSNWSWAAGAPFIGSMKEYVGGVLKGSWEWQYATTFTDLSGNGNTGTPSFKTTNSNAYVSAALVSFQPISEPTAPPLSVGEGGPFFDSSNVSSGNFTTGNSTLNFPLKGLIDAVATAGGVPYQIPSTFISVFVLLVASMLTSYFLRNNAANSLFAKSIVNLVFYGVYIALHIFDWWMLIFFLIFEVAIWMGAQHRRE